MILKKIKSTLVNLFDRFTAMNATISVGDLVNQRLEIEHNQFLLTSRLLDIEAFCNQGEVSFPWQNSISRKAYGSAHREEDGNRAFTRLIHSFQEKGYDQKSFFTVDHDLRLLDGNHRMGLCLFMDIYTINIRVLRRRVPVPKTIDWYLDVGLDSSFVKSVVDKYREVQKKMVESGNVFCAVLQDSELLLDLSFLTKVEKVDSFSGGDNAVFEGRKLPVNGVIVRFTLYNPQYCIKHGKVYSKRITEIKKIIQKRTKNIVIFSQNCLEGRNLFNLVKPYIISKKLN